MRPPYEVCLHMVMDGLPRGRGGRLNLDLLALEM